MKFYNVKNALNWMMQHPLKRLYDQYANYYIYIPELKIIEHHYVIDIENAIWDMDKLNINEFLEINEELTTN